MSFIVVTCLYNYTVPHKSTTIVLFEGVPEGAVKFTVSSDEVAGFSLLVDAQVCWPTCSTHHT